MEVQTVLLGSPEELVSKRKFLPFSWAQLLTARLYARKRVSDTVPGLKKGIQAYSCNPGDQA